MTDSPDSPDSPEPTQKSYWERVRDDFIAKSVTDLPPPIRLWGWDDFKSKGIPPPPIRLLGWDDLKAKGIKDSKPTIYRKIKSGKFPRPVYPGKSPAWPEHEVDIYLAWLIARRDASTNGGAR